MSHKFTTLFIVSLGYFFLFFILPLTKTKLNLTFGDLYRTFLFFYITNYLLKLNVRPKQTNIVHKKQEDNSNNNNRKHFKMSKGCQQQQRSG